MNKIKNNNEAKFHIVMLLFYIQHVAISLLAQTINLSLYLLLSFNDGVKESKNKEDGGSH